MDKLKNKKYTAHEREEPVHVQDQPFNLQMSGSQSNSAGHRESIYSMTRAAANMKNSSRTLIPKKNIFDQMEEMEKDL